MTKGWVIRGVVTLEFEDCCRRPNFDFKQAEQTVLVRKMPPRFTDGVHGGFSNDRRLSKEETDTIAAWADGGAKEGNAKEAPAPLAFAEGWAMGKPDAVIEMPAAYDVPASGTVEYTYFIVPTGFTEDKWVQSLDVRAGGRQVMHRIVLSSRAPMARTFHGVRAKRPSKRCCCCLRGTSGPFPLTLNTSTASLAWTLWPK